jgi:hypothetical protein
VLLQTGEILVVILGKAPLHGVEGYVFLRFGIGHLEALVLPLNLIVIEHLMGRYLVYITDHLQLLLFVFDLGEELLDGSAPLGSCHTVVFISGQGGVKEQLMLAGPFVFLRSDADHSWLHDLPIGVVAFDILHYLIGGRNLHLMLETRAPLGRCFDLGTSRSTNLGCTLSPCLYFDLLLNFLSCNFKL